MDKYKNLRIFNIVMGFFHFVQGILMVVLSNDFTLPINTSYLKFDVTTLTLQPTLNHVYDLRVGYAIAAFLFLSSLAHFIISLPKVYEWYVSNLKKGINYARWIEYAFSSSIMIVVVSMLVGVYDFSTLLLIFFLNAMMIQSNNNKDKLDIIHLWLYCRYSSMGCSSFVSLWFRGCR
ncbi:MAG: hypothetical protein US23_C0025G0008 [candidate division WS6 bacterium GW2011_GWE1_36_69]|nr:MAG: hypothetical protein US23_C0025G0008 [candidate division WS6 bacterium GW2011_GWE1_36_69]